MSPKNASIEMLTTKIAGKKMMPVIIRINKGATTHREHNRPGTEKFIYLLEGELVAEIGQEKYNLSRGDSLYFDASLAHVFSSVGQHNATALSVLSPPSI